MSDAKRLWRILYVASLIGLVGMGIGCGEAVEEGDGPSETGCQSLEQECPGYQRQPAALNEKVFVDVDEFESLRADGASVLDVRGEEDYEVGHVPGALDAPWSVFRDESREGAFVEQDVDIIESKARALGIDNDRPVLIYGDAITTTDARQAWALEYYGHGEVYILDGGFDAWIAESGVDATTDDAQVGEGNFEVGFRTSVIATADDVAAVANGEQSAILFDARSEDEFEGTDERDNPRHGHVPGAIHYEWTNVFDADGHLRPKEELRAELEQAGLLVDDAIIIPYCQGGFRSAVIYSVLRWLGHDDAKNYDGSWWEWSRANDYPVE